jgi:protein kinase-like protein/WD40 repeat protein
MELVEGETLADRIARGAVPVDEALPIAKQIAEALEAAHEQGIIHRDLKPANIKARADGTVKVLDFGLAKLAEPGSGIGDPGSDGTKGTLSAPATITSPALMTGVGVLLGTAAYMAPEQAKGRPADKRSDIWAFGCVLFEMLTGRRAFEGDDVAETLAAVLKSQPDLTKVPPQLQTLVTACLEKDPRKRLRDIGDAQRLVSEDLPAPTPRRLTWSAAAAIAAMVVVLTIAMTWLMTRPQDRSLIRLDVDLGPNAVSVGTNDVLISPDGTLIVFSIRTATGRPPQLATRRLDASVATPLPGTEDAQFPFFSPDSQWIGFFANRRLQKVSVQGGAPVTLSDAPNVLGASWGDDGYIVAGIDVNRGLVRIPESGGTPQPITERNAGEVHGLPQVLAGAQAVIFTARTLRLNSLSDANVEAVSVATRQRKKLVSRGYFGQYIPSMRSTGHLVYVSDGVLSGMQFDPSRLELQSQPVALIDGVPASSFFRAGSFSFSTTGTFVYRRESAAVATSQVMWLENSGKTESLLSKPAAYYNPYFSPDGQRLAVTLNSDRGRDISVYDPARDVMTRITYDGRSQNTVWAPDGRHLLYWHQSPAGYAIVSQRADGAAEPVVLLESKNTVVPTFVFARSAAVIFRNRSADTTGSLDAAFGFHGRGTPEGRQTGAVPQNSVHGIRARFLARWPLGCVPVRRDRQHPHLRSSLSRPRWSVADFGRRQCGSEPDAVTRRQAVVL